MRNFIEISKKSMGELIDYIVDEFHSPLRVDLEKLDKLIEDIYIVLENKKKILLPKEIFKQFKAEIIEHINKEEKDFFPEIINLEKWLKIDKQLLRKFIHIQEIEHNEIDNYLIWWKSSIQKLFKEKLDKYDELILLIDKIFSDTQDHTYIENNFLNPKVSKMV